MSKVITPMKRLKGQIDNLKINLEEEYTHTSKEKREGKIDYDSSYWGDRTEPKVISEIVSDHIIFFNTKPKNDQGGIPYKNHSFAISFDFMNKELEEQSIQFSYFNEENKLIHSKPFTVEEFKEHLKNLNKFIKSLDISPRTIVFEKIKDIVESNQYDINIDVKKAENDIELLLKKKKEEIKFDEAQKEANKNNERFQKVSDIIKSTIENSDEYKELQEIEKRQKELKEKIQNQIESLQTSYNFKELKAEKAKSDSILMLKNKEIEYEEKKALSKQTSAVRKRVNLKRT